MAIRGAVLGGALGRVIAAAGIALVAQKRVETLTNNTAFPESTLAVWEVERAELISDSNSDWRDIGRRIITGQVLYRHVAGHVDEKGETVRVAVSLESFRLEDGNITHAKPDAHIVGVGQASEPDKETELPLCAICGQPIDPKDDNGLLLRLLFGQLGEHRHILPVIEGEQVVCEGSPSSAQYIDGQPRTETHRPDMEEPYRDAYRQLQVLASSSRMLL